jgi:hypothetical protein
MEAVNSAANKVARNEREDHVVEVVWSPTNSFGGAILQGGESANATANQRSEVPEQDCSEPISIAAAKEPPEHINGCADLQPNCNNEGAQDSDSSVVEALGSTRVREDSERMQLEKNGRQKKGGDQQTDHKLICPGLVIGGGSIHLEASRAARTLGTLGRRLDVFAAAPWRHGPPAENVSRNVSSTRQNGPKGTALTEQDSA